MVRTSGSRPSRIFVLVVPLTLGASLATEAIGDSLPPWYLFWIATLLLCGIGMAFFALIEQRPVRRRRKVARNLEGVNPRWVDRPESDQVVDALIKDGASVALVGIGGYGKTWLADAVRNNTAVKAHFKGGVVRLSMREHDDDLGLINAVMSQLDDDAGRPASVDTARFNLKGMLLKRGPVLLVLDDVRTSAQLGFLGEARRVTTRMLVTTRLPELVAEPDFRCVTVGKMTEQATATMLRYGLEGLSQPLIDELVKLTRRWPILMVLVNQRIRLDIRRGADVQHAAKHACTRLKESGPYVFGADGESLAAVTIEYSMEALSEEERLRFRELCVFPVETDIPLDLVGSLWAGMGGLTQSGTDTLCERLSGLSLVELRWLPSEKRLLKLHDVIHDYLVSRHALAPDYVARAHRAVLEGPLERPVGDPCPWWELPVEEAYLVEYVTFHLQQGGLQEELDTLVSDPRWLVRRLRQSGPQGAFEDVTRTCLPDQHHISTYFDRYRHLFLPLSPPHAALGNVLTHLHRHLGLKECETGDAGEFGSLFFLPHWPFAREAVVHLPRTHAAHSGPVGDIAISPDGSWMIGVADGVVHQWAADGAYFRTFPNGTTGRARKIYLSPTGAWLVTLSEREAVLWTEHGDYVATLNADGDTINDVSIAADGTWLATVGRHSCRLWTCNGESVAALPADDQLTTVMDIAPDGTWLATGTSHGRVDLWGPGGQRITSVDVHNGPVEDLAIAPDGRWFVTVGRDGKVAVWGADGGARGSHQASRASIDIVEIAPCGDWFATRSSEREVHMWRVGEPGLAQKLLATDIWSIAISPDSRWLATGTGTGIVRLWEPVAGSCVTAARVSAKANDVIWFPDGTRLAATGAGGIHLLALARSEFIETG